MQQVTLLATGATLVLGLLICACVGSQASNRKPAAVPAGTKIEANSTDSVDAATTTSKETNGTEAGEGTSIETEEPTNNKPNDQPKDHKNDPNKDDTDKAYTT